MPKLSRWIVAKKMMHLFPTEVLQKLLAMGANIGGGWCEIHQHINVSPQNRDEVVAYLESQGYDVVDAEEYRAHTALEDHPSARTVNRT